MALSSASLFLYSLEITPTSRFVTFGTTSLEVGMAARTATLNVGFYSLTSLMSEFVRALTAADPLHIYTASADRTIMGGLQNRVTVGTSGSYLSIYFSSGNPSNPASVLGFNNADYIGATSYTGSSTCGTILIPNQLGYNYTSPNQNQKNFGALNISASGKKESITFSLQSFWQVQFKYIPLSSAETIWVPLIQWMIQQREFEFTPEISNPSVFFPGTLEDPNQGLMLNLTEMLPDYPNTFQTPLMMFRVST